MAQSHCDLRCFISIWRQKRQSNIQPITFTNISFLTKIISMELLSKEVKLIASEIYEFDNRRNLNTNQTFLHLQPIKNPFWETQSAVVSCKKRLEVYQRQFRPGKKNSNCGFRKVRFGISSYLTTTGTFATSRQPEIGFQCTTKLHDFHKRIVWLI